MIIPAILEKDWVELQKKLEICREFASSIHVDFIDGKFVDNTSYLEFENFKKYSEYFNFEAHLMVEEPIEYLEKLSNAGFKTFLGHIEKMHDQVEFVAKAEALGEVGLALDLHTSLDDIKVSLDDLDRILLMSVVAGKSGQEFDESVLEKIKSLRSKYLGNIEIDGGVNDKTLPPAKAAGVNSFCVTSYLFKENPVENFRKLEKIVRDSAVYH
jgi:ribulose-phosphate 3-epimerase